MMDFSNEQDKSLCLSHYKPLHFFLMYLFFFQLFLAEPCSMGDLSSRPEIEPMPPALAVQNFNPQTSRQVPKPLHF